MNKILKIKKLLILAFLILIIPLFLFAASPCPNTCPKGSYQFETGIPFLFQQCQCVPSTQFLPWLNSFIKYKLFPLAGFIGFLVIIYSGFEYALSGGNSSKQKEAQNRITNVIIGIALLFLMWLILYIINPNILNTKNLELPQFNFNVSYNNFSNNTQYSGSIPPDLNIALQKTALKVPVSEELKNANPYLASQLATKLNSLQTTYKWYVTDACIGGYYSNKDFPCKTTCSPQDPDCSTRHSNDAHYYGLAVDIVTSNDPENKNLVPLAREICKKGLDVLVENDHLHVVLSKADYSKLGITTNVLGISPGTNQKWSMGQWYTQGNCDK